MRDHQLGTPRRLGDKRLNFLINFGRRRVAVRTFARHLIKHQPAVILMENLITELAAHTLLNDHIARNLCRTAQVAARTRCHAIVAIFQLLGDTSAHSTR